MILEAYHQRLLGQITDGQSGGAGVYCAWAVIDGRTGALVGVETSNRTVTAAGTTDEVLGYDPGTTVGATITDDPKRMRKVTTIMVYNSRVIPLAIQFYVQKMAGAPTGYAGTYRITPSFSIPAGGMLLYSAETGWRVYDATGQFGIAGPTGPQGATGATGPTGSDGWTYVKLANDFGNTSGTLADVTGMSFSASANTNYEIEVFGNFTTAATTTGMGMAFTVPASATVAGTMWHPVSTTALGSSFTRATGAATGNTASVDAAAPSIVPFTGKWTVKNANTAGTVQLQMRTEVSTSAATLLGGSVWLKYRTIS